jgi:hypothetical protein
MSDAPLEGGPVGGNLMPGETEAQVSTRQLIELLNEARVAMPGAQIIFAFLLTVPFAARFGQLDAADRLLYTFTLLSSALAVSFFIAAAAVHRVLFRRREREYVIRTGQRLVLTGLGFIAVTMSCALGFVLGFVFGNGWGYVATAVSFALFTGMWFVVPLAHRMSARDARPPGP